MATRKSVFKKKSTRVSHVIRCLWPDSVFAVFVWDRKNPKSKVEVSYISNSELEESAGLMRDASRQLRKMSLIAKGRGRIGNACVAIGLIPLLLMLWFSLAPAKYCRKLQTKKAAALAIPVDPRRSP